MSEITRREFFRQAAIYGYSASQLLAACSGLPALAVNERRISPGLGAAPYFNLPAAELVNVRGDRLHIGSAIYPFRKNADAEWLLSECRALGLNGIRFSFPREHMEHVPNTGAFDASHFHNPYSGITRLIRNSGLDVILTIHGHPGDRKGDPVEWPRNPDGTINGAAAAGSYANYTRWLVNHTKDFAHTFEMWNEAFGHIEDQKFKKSFGPGGSKQNADNYAALVAPAIAQVRQQAPHAKVTIEGNYWNVATSAAKSKLYCKLLSEADFVIRHPYSYTPTEYLTKGAENRNAYFYEEDQFYRSINPRLQWWYTEYNVTAKPLGVTPAQLHGALQAKALLRSTVLHLRHGITHLDVFALFYPSSPELTLIDVGGTRRPAWFALRNFIALCGLNKPAVSGDIQRTSALPSSMRDLSVATANGFSYMVWQETDATAFKDKIVPARQTVSLRHTEGRRLAFGAVTDPLTGKDVSNVRQQPEPDGSLSLTLPVLDYPLVVQLRVAV